MPDMLGPPPEAGVLRTAPPGALLLTRLRHLEAGLLPDPVHAFAVQLFPAFLPQEHRDAAVTVARILPGQLKNSLSQGLFIRRPLFFVTERRPWNIQCDAGPALGH